MAQINITFGIRMELAQAMAERGNFWAGIGRTAAWPTESDPPDVVGDEIVVDGVQFYKKSLLYSPVYQSDENDFDIYLNGVYWKKASTYADVKANSANFWYVRFILDKDEGPSITFRQIGIFANLTPAAGNENATILTPSEVDDPGNLVLLENRTLVTRDPLTRGESLEYILTF
jgi:hypothetical protein